MLVAIVHATSPNFVKSDVPPIDLKTRIVIVERAHHLERVNHSSVRGESSVRVIDGRGIGVVAEIVWKWSATFGPWSASKFVALDLRIIIRQMSRIQFSQEHQFVIACTRDGLDLHCGAGQGDIWPQTFVGTKDSFLVRRTIRAAQLRDHFVPR